jgi:hypothetical protein
LYGENFVTNLQLSADITYNPAMDKVTAAPQSSYPDRVVLGSTLFKYSTLYMGGTALYGLGSNGANGRFTPSSGPMTTEVVEQIGERHWIIWSISASKTNPTLCTVLSAVEIKFKGISPTNVNLSQWDIRSQAFDHLGSYGDTGTETSVNWTGPISLADVHLLTGISRGLGWGAWQTNSVEWWTLKVPFSMTLASVELAMYNAFNSCLDWMFPYPIPDKDYGDLAMDAAKKVDRNNVNMIAFLRDLRHPGEMIPRLKNLKSLKGLSSNYLSVDYGILPTISDLQNIIAAFKKMGPYLDKNGFKTYSAGFTESKAEGEYSFSLEQHLKLAIDNEDDLFQQLTEELDSWGFLPTLTNVWDLVPYSFVVDWFVNVGDLLERVDTRLNLLQYNIRYVTMSRKTITTKKIGGSVIAPFYGTVQVVDYHRWVSDQCPLPPLSLGLTFQDFNHWLEAGALLLQRIK